MSQKITKFFSRESKQELGKATGNNVKIGAEKEGTVDAKSEKSKVRKHVCRICNKSYSFQSGLAGHKKVKHSDGNFDTFECDFCGKQFKTKQVIKQHLKIHLPTVECHICKAEMKVLSLKAHLREVHTKHMKVRCQICARAFNSKYQLKEHEKTHNKQFQCQVCSKKFPSQGRLNAHQRDIHDNPRSFSCEECGKKFNQKVGLRNHQIIHEWHRPKPFMCEKCDYSTDMKGNFEAHQKVHQRREEKYAAMKNAVNCEKCGKLSRNKKLLRMHMKAVHPAEPFQCDLCGAYIKSFINLKKHLARYHVKTARDAKF